MNGRLGAWELYPGTPQAVYLCNRDKATSVNLNICNRHNDSAFVSVAISTSATAPSNAEWIEYGIELLGKGVLERTGIVVSPGQYLIVKSTTKNVNAVCWGIEMGVTLGLPEITQNPGALPVWVTSATLPDIGANDSTSIQLVASDSDTVELTYSLTAGTLPAGLALSPSGLISGTPTAGTYVSGASEGSSFTISASDSLTTIPQLFSITKKWFDGSSAALASRNALKIKNMTGTTTNGYYWIKPLGASTAYQVHCDMNTSGGGWMLMSFCGTGVSNGAHVIDAYSGSAFNMGTTATSITSTNQSNGTAGNMGQSFINAVVEANRGAGVAVFRIEDAGTTWNNWYFSILSTANWNPIASRQSALDNAGNTWLKQAANSHNPGAENGGAGSVGGSPVQYGGENWGTFPFNMNIGSGTNWGYSISPNYIGGFPAYNSAHSSGWNRRASFWIRATK